MRGLTLAVVDHAPALSNLSHKGLGVRVAGLGHGAHRGDIRREPYRLLSDPHRPGPFDSEAELRPMQDAEGLGPLFDRNR
jgi:hypothetical protein